MKTHHFLAIAAILALASCARPAYEQRGFASYIADHYAGHHTSSGDIYSPYGWTAAHQVLPFGTQVKVKNNYNGRSVNLTINDRFPAYPGRIINVSRAAAEYLQIPPGQMADVTVTAKTIPGMMPQQQAPAYTGAPPPNYGTTPPPSYGTTPPPSYGTTPPPSYGTTPPPSYNTRPPATSAPPANYNAPPPTLTPPPVFNEAPPPGYGLPRAQ